MKDFVGLGEDPLGLKDFDPLGRKKEKKRDSRRSFSKEQKKKILYQQNYKCAKCHKLLHLNSTDFDHINPWADKGKTVTENGAALCKNCHGMKTTEDRIKKMEKKPKSEKRYPLEVDLPKIDIGI